MGIITDDDRKMILEKVKQNPTASTPLETTFITGFKQLAHNLNAIVASHLPFLNPNQWSLISIAIDYYNEEPKNIDETEKLFSKHTNYPCEIILKKEAESCF